MIKIIINQWSESNFSDAEPVRAPLSASESDPLPFLDPTKKAWILAAAANDVGGWWQMRIKIELWPCWFRGVRPPWEFVKKITQSLYKMAKHKLKLVQFLVWWLCAWRWKSWAGWKASGTSPERAFPTHSVRPLLWLHSHALGSKGGTNTHSHFFEAQNFLRHLDRPLGPRTIF